MDSSKTVISADALVNAPIDTVWEAWVNPVHMAEWNNTSEEWHTPKAENDLRTGGKLFLRMETKDGSSGFNFEAIYDDVIINEKITETSDPVKEHSLEFQQSFCQAILNNFKTYTENL
ncbi:MAG TPA: SRPBCC domain-containing protein [Puia sp.]|nr:SRPBCC domain-containing protein [Puia sp.]